MTWKSEVFGVNAVRSGGLECVYAPVHRLLHGRSAGNASANLVGQRRRLVSSGEGFRASAMTRSAESWAKAAHTRQKQKKKAKLVA